MLQFRLLWFGAFGVHSGFEYWAAKSIALMSPELKLYVMTM